MAIYCGGLQTQWNVNDHLVSYFSIDWSEFVLNVIGGKCGICGERYDRANKLFEKDGAMYTGKIVKTYTSRQQIDVAVVVSLVYHL